MILEIVAEQFQFWSTFADCRLTEVFGACKSELQSDLDVNGMMNFGYVELRLIIEWSRKVPGWFILNIVCHLFCVIVVSGNNYILLWIVE